MLRSRWFPKFHCTHFFYYLIVNLNHVSRKCGLYQRNCVYWEKCMCDVNIALIFSLRALCGIFGGFLVLCIWENCDVNLIGEAWWVKKCKSDFRWFERISTVWRIACPPCWVGPFCFYPWICSIYSFHLSLGYFKKEGIVKCTWKCWLLVILPE